MIVIPVQDGEEAVDLHFRYMPPEEAAEWAAKIQSRIIFREKLVKEREAIDKTSPLDRDDDVYIGLCDRIAKLQKDVLKIAASMAGLIEKPDKERIDQLMKNRTLEMTTAFMDYIAKLFPSEEEVKKS